MIITYNTSDDPGTSSILKDVSDAAEQLKAKVVAGYGKCVKFRRLGLESFSKGYGTYDEVKKCNGIGAANVCGCTKNDDYKQGEPE